MPMRRTVGISLAFIVISAGAIAKTPEKNASHPPGQLDSVRPGKAESRTGKTWTASCKAAHGRRSAARSRRPHTASDSFAQSNEGAPDPYWGPARAAGRSEYGKAAWYGLVGNPTSSGERLDTVTATAAHRSLPLASYARVTSLDSGRSVVVKINDRGPYTRGFIIDLSPRAADEIDMRHKGVAAVLVEPLADELAPTAARFETSGAAVAP
jgi:rare lipoprotein A